MKKVQFAVLFLAIAIGISSFAPSPAAKNVKETAVSKKKPFIAWELMGSYPCPLGGATVYVWKSVVYPYLPGYQYPAPILYLTSTSEPNNFKTASGEYNGNYTVTNCISPSLCNCDYTGPIAPL